LLRRLNGFLLLWGIPGLLGIAFLDSAAVPLVGGPDFVVVVLAWQRPLDIILIILAAAVGSTLGCLVLYRIARAGGEMALSRFGPEKRTWVKQKLDHNAFTAVAAAVAAPPPFPTKLVILAAGAFQVNQIRFANGVLAGRLLRYAILAYLGARFGNEAAGVIKQHYPVFLVVLLAALIAGVLARYFSNRGKRP
jgi:membrane protein YqaA with SNARE-associated domain